MNEFSFTRLLTCTAEELSDATEMEKLFRQHRYGDLFPSGDSLKEVISIYRSVLFPGYYGKSNIDSETLKSHIGASLERFYMLLAKQVEAGLCFASESTDSSTIALDAVVRRETAETIAAEFVRRLPAIRRVLATDVKATFQGDPAAANYSEVICCYPVIKAISNFRMAHELYTLGVPLIPRIITEMAHGETGIDIHPAAAIGRYFTIDHGTGVVIGATCIIGDHVKLYQGVTLGAKSFPTDNDGNILRGEARHPILEDSVIVYSNATILGRITIGQGAVIGGNIWVTESVPAGAQIVQHRNTPQ